MSKEKICFEERERGGGGIHDFMQFYALVDSAEHNSIDYQI